MSVFFSNRQKFHRIKDDNIYCDSKEGFELNRDDN